MKGLKKGFTLVELMVVITVIAILMTIAIVSFTRIQKQARDTKRKADIRTLETALQAYYTELQHYPIQPTVLDAGSALSSFLSPNYIPSIPTAPLGSASTNGNTSYMYISDTNGFTYSLCTALETASTSAGMWVVSTSNAGGFGTADVACCAPGVGSCTF
jgi:prepilin-type N-terminal cleavage/methylation domain-containing protein